MEKTYGFDASALINPFRRHYPFDIFPTYWRALEARIANGEVRASELVRDEIFQKDDELSTWAKLQIGMFEPVDVPQQQSVAEILSRFPAWINPTTGKNNGDPFVIAHARCNDLIVVSDEGNGSQTHPTIPFVCRTFDVKHIKVVEFMRRINLVL